MATTSSITKCRSFLFCLCLTFIIFIGKYSNIYKDDDLHVKSLSRDECGRLLSSSTSTASTWRGHYRAIQGKTHNIPAMKNVYAMHLIKLSISQSVILGAISLNTHTFHIFFKPLDLDTCTISKRTHKLTQNSTQAHFQRACWIGPANCTHTNAFLRNRWSHRSNL